MWHTEDKEYLKHTGNKEDLSDYYYWLFFDPLVAIYFGYRQDEDLDLYEGIIYNIARRSWGFGITSFVSTPLNLIQPYYFEIEEDIYRKIHIGRSCRPRTLNNHLKDLVKNRTIFINQIEVPAGEYRYGLTNMFENNILKEFYGIPLTKEEKKYFRLMIDREEYLKIIKGKKINKTNKKGDKNNENN